MASLLEILQDPNYTEANAATKEAIFNKYSAQDTNYTSANEATQFAIRNKFGIATPEEVPVEKPKRKSEDVGYFEGLAGAAKRGIESVADVGSGLSLAGSAAVGAGESARAKMTAIKEEAKKEAETPATSFADLERIYEEKGLLSTLGQVPKYVTEQVVSSAPQMAIPLAAGAAASPFLTPIGGMLVGMGTYGIQQFGNFIMRQAQEKESPEELELSKAALAAGATAPLGYLVDRWTAGLGGLGPKKAGAEIAKELTARQAAAAAGKRVLTGAAEGIIAEAPLEVLEQAAERWQAGLDLTGDDAYKEYKEAFFGAAAAGAAIKGTTKGLGIGEGQPQQAPGPQIESAEGTPLPVQPLDTAQKEVAAEAAGKPPIGTAVNEQEIAKLAATIEADLGVPYESAELIAREQLNAGRDTTGANNAAVTGSAQPGVSLPNDGGAAPTGLVPPNLSGLAGPSGLTGEPNGGAGQQPSTLTAPAPLAETTPIQQAVDNVRTAEVELAAAVTSVDKKEAQKKLNVAKQTAQQVAKSVTPLTTQTPPSIPKTEAAPIEQISEVSAEPTEVTTPTEVVETNAPIKPPTPVTDIYSTEAVKKAGKEAFTSGDFTPTQLKDGSSINLVNMQSEDTGEIQAYTQSGELIGSLSYNTAEDNGVRFNPTVEVNEKYRRKGVATAMYKLAEQTGGLIPAVDQAGQVRSEAGIAFRNALAAPPTLQAPVVGKKVGRKALPPEQKAASDLKRAGRRGEIKGVNKQVSNAAALLDTPLDVSGIDTEQGIKTAEDNYRIARRQALEDLYTVSVTPRNKGLGASKLATERLNKEDVTQADRDLAKDRYEFKKKAGVNKATATNDAANPAYNTFTSVQEAIKYIAKSGSRFEKALANRLAPFLKDVRFIVAQSEQDVPTIRLENGETLQQAFEGASGIYATAVGADGKRFKYIVLRGENFGDPSMQGINNTIFLHEALHAATVAKIDEYYSLKESGKPIPAALQDMMDNLYAVMQSAKNQYDEMVLQAKVFGEELPAEIKHKFDTKKNGGLDISEDPKEFIAYGLTHSDVQQLLLNASGAVSKARDGLSFKDLFSKFVDVLRKAFGMGKDHKSALQDLMLVTEGLLQQQERAPAETSATNKANKANDRLDKDMEAIKLSNDAHGVTNSLGNAIRNKDFGPFKDLYEASLPAMGNAFITKTLKTLQSSDIIRWVGDKIPGLKRLDDAAQHMAGMRSLMMQASAKKADQLGKFIRKNKGGMKALADSMHLARLQNQDPATTTVPELKAAWDKLGTMPGGHDMYRMVEKFYKDNYTLVRHLLDQRIDSMGLDEESKKGLMLQIRQMQEEGKQGIYFPFMREGKFWLRVDGPNGKEFYMFESGTQRNLFEIQRAKELGLDIKDARTDGVFMSGDSFADMKNKGAIPESKMLTEMFAAIDKATAKPGIDKDSLKDQLYQAYLMTLPEESIRKQFIHAENITGFSADIFRNFKTSAMRLANQASKLKYGAEMQAAIQQGKDSLAGNPDRAKLGLFIDELTERANAELNPPEQSWLATKLNQIAYYWLLTGAASAATQLASIPVMVMPSLNAEYGYAKSAKMFSKYALSKSLGVTREDADGNVTYHAPSIGDSQMVKKSPLLQKAFKEFVARGVTTDTNVSVLTNRNRTPANAYDSQPGAFLRSTANVMSSLFNGAERLSREATAMMTFELEYAKTKDFDASVQKAIDTTQELLGRYDNFNRPTVMRGFIGKTLGQFKMYAVNMTSFFLRNAYNMHKVLFKDQRQEGLDAMHRLTGVLAMGGMFHGLVGMPGYSVITSAIDAVLDSLGDEEEKRKRRINNAFSANNSNLRFRYEFLPSAFGEVKITGLDGRQHTLAKVLEKGAISELTDMNIGSRTSFDGMWYRGAPPGKDAKETINNVILANLGPGVSTLTNMAGSVDDFHNGHILRGLEKLVPAFFKNPITATRIAQEGVTTKRGDAMLKKDEVGKDTVVAQALGFQSTRVARMQEQNFETQKEVIAADRSRKDLLSRLDEALLSVDSTPKDKQNIVNQIYQHNNRYPIPGVVINTDTINRSLDRAIANKGLTLHGQQIKKNLLPYLYKLNKAASPTK